MSLCFSVYDDVFCLISGPSVVLWKSAYEPGPVLQVQWWRGLAGAGESSPEDLRGRTGCGDRTRSRGGRAEPEVGHYDMSHHDLIKWKGTSLLINILLCGILIDMNHGILPTNWINIMSADTLAPLASMILIGGRDVSSLRTSDAYTYQRTVVSLI